MAIFSWPITCVMVVECMSFVSFVIYRVTYSAIYQKWNYFLEHYLYLPIIATIKNIVYMRSKSKQPFSEKFLKLDFILNKTSTTKFMYC